MATRYDIALRRHCVGRIERDDLAYTDDVIATLQSELDAREIADALNISDTDVLYHVQEVRLMRHRGRVLRPQASMDSLGRAYLGTPPKDDYVSDAPDSMRDEVEQPIQITVTVDWAEALRRRQAAEASESQTRISEALRRRRAAEDAEYQARMAAGEAKSLQKKPRKKREPKMRDVDGSEMVVTPYMRKVMQRMPRDTEWYAARAAHTAARELGVSRETAVRCAWALGYQYGRYYAMYPIDPEWWACRTIRQAAADLQASYASVCAHVRNHRLLVRNLPAPSKRWLESRGMTVRDNPWDDWTTA
jgi:hypothetical protein